ncbi:MAG: hypothetical protein M3O91_09685 [Chloroflexota bacterium]|nr:hypothetical protein [Chloroflexota bacterium]
MSRLSEASYRILPSCMEILDFAQRDGPDDREELRAITARLRDHAVELADALEAAEARARGAAIRHRRAERVR